ncbi:2,4-dienoyl-CoA reductase-like NADH-dependent reductase (Old Yellow Enzyme family) [Humitalea rosea]|uniref:2,4-dienoyl-CoA reductase-like NADH-dependent reductase (Old Yellow Enzyme family) n=1 Tax=Humitalea rosea TaxID=990373 RepID=A0A2W7IQA0_9PROT|nr:NADH:flavin oxidoreductase/NADH oxidase [Humitalea rosea]PZW40843.1 2,4-dienoyl-CoA reductase-like NADH-dependent reductase (Old Yellow Enzyme family) [Humitalea rosea]
MTATPTPLLFTPYALRGVTLRNRIVVSPMSQYRSDPGGLPGDWHLVHLGKFAMGGAGMVFCEETSVSERSRKTYDCPGIWTDEQARAWRRITDFCHAQGTVMAMQIGHAGRKVATRAPWDGFSPLTEADAAMGRPPWSGLAPSPVAFKPGAMLPKEMDQDDIRHVIRLHADAAKRSLDAGFDVLEIHAAHGYIIQQFLSPITNHRTDGYGGGLEARMRFGLELTEAVREAWPADKPLLLRLSCTDGRGGAWSMEDSIAFAHALKPRGIDMIDCSSGGIEGPLTLAVVPRVPGYHVPYAARIKAETGVPTMAVGLITEAQQAEGYLQAGACDLVALAREMMWNPNWPAHAAAALGADPLALLPPSYAWWLEKREEVRRLTA